MFRVFSTSVSDVTHESTVGVVPISTAPTSVQECFKDIFYTDDLIQVNVDENSVLKGNVNVLLPNGKLYVFHGNNITHESKSISSASGQRLESGEGWTRINASTTEQACADIKAVILEAELTCWDYEIHVIQG